MDGPKDRTGSGVGPGRSSITSAGSPSASSSFSRRAPPSFSAHRRSLSKEVDVPRDVTPDSPVDSMSNAHMSSINHATPPPPAAAGGGGHRSSNSRSSDSPTTSAYRIPQRGGSVLAHHGPGHRAPPPTPAQRGTRAAPGSIAIASGPVDRSRTAWTSVSRLAGAAAARGVSHLDFSSSPSGRKKGDTPTLASAPVHTVQTATLTGSRRWPSTPRTPRSPGSTPSSPGMGRTRGLTVAILMGDGEILAESAPVTPSLANVPRSAVPTLELEFSPSRPNPLSASLRPAPNTAGLLSPDSNMRGPATGGGGGPATGRVEELILCRYYHTPGLTCTSSPCRFVHRVDSARRVPASPLATAALSARTATVDSHEDPTRGTFAAAQAAAPVVPLKIDAPDLAAVESGAPVEVTNGDTGAETLGYVFKMSGGGKGPAGKAKAKFKTVPCRDFAEGHCPYGTYCSFIHDPDNLYNAEKHAVASKGGEGKVTPPSEVIVTPVLGSSPTVPAPDSVETVAEEETVKEPPPTPADAITQVVITSSNSRPAPLLRDPPRKRESKHLDKHSALKTSRPDSQTKPAAKGAAATWDPPPRHRSPQAPPPSAEHNWSPHAGFTSSSASPDQQWAEEQWPGPQWARAQWTDDVAVTYGPVPSTYTTVQTAGAVQDVWNPVAPPNTAALSPVTSQFWALPLSPTALMAPISQQLALMPPMSPLMAAAPAVVGPHAHAPLSTTPKPALPSIPPPITIATEQLTASPQLTAMPASAPPPAAATAAAMASIPPGPASAVGAGPAPPKLARRDISWTPNGWQVKDNAAMSPGVQGQGTARNYYRTRACRFFAQGNCPHGDACTYIHVLPDRPGVPASAGVPAAAASPIAAASPRHVGPKTVACKFFNSAAGCAHSEQDCNFAHTRVVPESQPLVAFPRAYRTRPCRHFQAGRCSHGDACHFAHVNVDDGYAFSPVASSARFSSPTSPTSADVVAPAPAPQTPRRPSTATPTATAIATADSPARDSPASPATPASAFAPHSRVPPSTPMTPFHRSSSSAIAAAGPRCASAPAAPPGAGSPLATPGQYRDGDGVEQCADWAKTGRCLRVSCPFPHVGEGGEGNAAQLTEAALAEACEELRKVPVREAGDNDDDDEDDDDDDLEIITVATTTASLHSAPNSISGASRVSV